MPNYVVSATGRYVLTGQSPSSDAIIRAINTTFPPGSATWVGPSPRITRTGTDSSIVLGPFGSGDVPTVHVVWVFSLQNDDPATAATVANAMQGALGTLGGTWNAAVSPFDTALNGDLSWWQSGQDANSPTRDQFLTFGGPNIASESPVGPSTTPSVGQQLNPFSGGPGGAASPISQITTLLEVVAVVVGIGVVSYAAWPLISGVHRMQPPVRRQARLGSYQNPSRHRHLRRGARRRRSR